jgi:ABC-2 type transport system ATP-binding protein
MRRRLEIARGLLHNPKVLFLDEPTLGLDPQSREHIWHYIEGLVAENKMSIIITTHYMEEADRLCDRIAIVDHGKVVVLDTPENLKRELGGDIVKLEIKEPNLKAVEALPYVKKVEVKGSSVFLTVTDAGAHVQEILSLVGKVSMAELRPPSLDDVFMHYTGREYKEEGEEGDFWERAMTASERR